MSESEFVSICDKEMPQFNYRAKTGAGKTKDGIIQAENKTVVIKRLREEGLYPVSIEELNPQAAKRSYKKINSRDISAFTRQLANLIHSGFSLANALSTLSQQEQGVSGMRKLIDGLHERIQKGSTFSAALNACPGTFSSFYINMVNIGEASGKLDESLAKLADFKEREEELLSQIKSALTYPAFLFAVGIITIFVMMAFFIPRFAAMFSDLGQVLPLPTQIIIQISEFMSRSWWLLIAITTAAVVLAKAYYKIEQNRLIVDGFILRLPLINNLIQKVEIARFSYALGVLLNSGVPILEALGVVSLSVDNRIFRKKIYSFQDRIRKGQSLSNCLQSDSLFPPILINMVRVGEESGELSAMLLKVARTFETEVSRTLKTIISLIEPVLILFIGGIVVLIVLSILLPVFRIDLLAR